MWKTILNRLFPNPTAPHLQQGSLAERQAQQYLAAQGLTWVCSNFRCKRGEIDLIMREKQTLVIVEVRYRQNDRCGNPLETVTRRKQSRIIAATRYYLAKHPSHQTVRFDVIAVSGTDLRWVRNAFQA
ncbi:MAG: YraN family protein [Gammaproteobacteria bacterium]